MACLVPYVSPSIPFTGPIYGGLQSGMMVIISGTVRHTCNRFHINFQCGSRQTPQSDIAFHFNPRFEEGGYVVCNTLERESWGREERKKAMPFVKGHAFEIRVLVKHDSFLVAVNGSHFVEYKHRIPLARVDTIAVSGDVEVAIINFQGVAEIMSEGIGTLEAVADIKLSSAGWVAVTAHLGDKFCLQAYTPEGTTLMIRRPPLFATYS